MEKRLKVLVVEDEFITLNRIAQALTSMGYTVEADAMSAKEAVEVLQGDQTIDLALLDISLKGQKDGMWLANFINNNYNIPFIFLTAYRSVEYIQKASKLNPAAYLIKPFDNEELFAAIEIAMANSEKVKPKNTVSEEIVLKSNRAFVKVRLEDIEFVESNGNYIDIHSKANQLRSRQTLKQFSEILPKNDFIQVHRSFIVSKCKIDQVTATHIHLGKQKIPVSKKYKNTISAFALGFQRKTSQD